MFIYRAKKFNEAEKLLLMAIEHGNNKSINNLISIYIIQGNNNLCLQTIVTYSHLIDENTLTILDKYICYKYLINANINNDYISLYLNKLKHETPIIHIIYNQLALNKIDVCKICCIENSPIITLFCTHEICLSCFNNLFKNNTISCPFCRCRCRCQI